MSPTNPKNISGEEVAKETEFTIKSNNMPSTSTKVPLLFLFCFVFLPQPAVVGVPFTQSNFFTL